MTLRWAVLLLVLANLGFAGYLVFIDRGAPVTDVGALELNADQVKLLKPGEPEAKTACLEWHNLSESDLPRAQEQLVKLRPGGISVRERAIVIADPSPVLIARLAELKAAFIGSELRAIACLPNAP
jgi:hypothetical protein